MPRALLEELSDLQEENITGRPGRKIPTFTLSFWVVSHKQFIISKRVYSTSSSSLRHDKSEMENRAWTRAHDTAFRTPFEGTNARFDIDRFTFINKLSSMRNVYDELRAWHMEKHFNLLSRDLCSRLPALHDSQSDCGSRSRCSLALVAAKLDNRSIDWCDFCLVC